MTRPTRKRTLVKTLVYRLWVILTTYAMLVITGQTAEQAILPAVVINLVWTCSYYIYDRIWAHIEWGNE
jgi:uncharacterized membrane protein